MNSRSKGSSRFRAMAAVLCLFAYMQAAGMFAMFLGLGASAEGSHAVSLSCTPDQVSIVLHHQPAAEAGGFEHRHGVASRIVCLLGESGPMPQADHVATFSSNSTCEQTPGELKANPPESLSETSFGPISDVACRSAPSVRNPTATLSVPALSSALRATRMTVLLL